MPNIGQNYHSEAHWVILLKEQTALNSSDLQFGFKLNVSTTQCTFALNETISYYNSRKLMFMLHY